MQTRTAVASSAATIKQQNMLKVSFVLTLASIHFLPSDSESSQYGLRNPPPPPTPQKEKKKEKEIVGNNAVSVFGVFVNYGNECYLVCRLVGMAIRYAYRSVTRNQRESIGKASGVFDPLPCCLPCRFDPFGGRCPGGRAGCDGLFISDLSDAGRQMCNTRRHAAHSARWVH